MPHDVYAPPQAIESFPGSAPSLAHAARLRNRSLALFGISILALFGVGVASAALESRLLLFAAGGTCALLALVGAGTAVASVAKSFAAMPRDSIGAIFLAATSAVANLGMAGVGALAALLSTMSFTRGRQIRRFGKVLLPPVGPSSESNDWTRPLVDASVIDFDDVLRREDVDDTTRSALAAQWRENGRTEHASVAAFARLTLDLVALGAPPELVAAAQRDALDEIRHAELCFALARAIDGRSESPSAFPAAARARTLSRVRSVALVELAVDSLIDGALHEGVSARIVAKLARRAADPTVRAILRQIAADEGRHSAHGWDVVRFCLAEGGAPVAFALASAVASLPDAMRSELPGDAAAGGWERWGIMGSALEAAEFAGARASVERRVAELVAPYGVTAAAA